MLDFGLVKHDAASASAQTLVTGTDMAAGTPAYMPPEVVTGEPIDGLLDLYSLGCVGYFLLTGQLVFEAEESAIRMIREHSPGGPGAPLCSDWSADSEGARPPHSGLSGQAARGPPRQRGSAGAEARGDESQPWSQEDARAWWSSNLGSSLRSSSVVFPTARTTQVAAPLGLL